MSADLRALWRAAGGNVPDHWTFQTIEELLESQKSISVGVMYPGSNVLGGTPLIRVSDVKNGVIAKKPDFCISFEVDQEYRRTKLFGSELLITLVGNPGDCVIVTEEMIGWNAARALAVLKLKDPDLRRWLRYVLLSKPAKHLIDARLNTTVQKTLNLKDIRELGVPIPPKDERYKITNVIDAIENKMLLNTQTNQTLESIAQAIFKSWFVDFEPVKAKMAVLAEGGTREQAELAAMGAISGKSEAELAQLQQQNPEHYQQLAETAALFPSAMVESELGEIPEGWEVSDFGSVYVCYDSKRIPLSKMEREKKKGTIPYYGATSVMDYVDEPIFDGIYLLLGEDGSVLKEDGTPFIQYIWGPSWVNNHAHVLQGKDDVSTEQLLLFISTQNISAYVTGAVQLKLNQKNMSGIPFIKAPAQINRHFYTKIKVLFEKKRLISEETNSLANLRDSLLPKLLSGEIDLSDIQSEVA